MLRCFPGGLVGKGGFVDQISIIPSATQTRGTPYKIVCWNDDEARRREAVQKQREEAEADKKSDEKADEKPDVKADVKADAKADAKADVKADAKKPDVKADTKADAKKPDEKADAKKSDTPAASDSGQVLGPPVTYLPAAQYRGGCEQEGQHSVFYLFNVFPVSPPLNPEYAISVAVQRLEGDTMINIRAWHETHYYSAMGRVSVFKVRGDVIRYLTPKEQRELYGIKDDADKKGNPGRDRGGKR